MKKVIIILILLIPIITVTLINGYFEIIRLHFPSLTIGKENYNKVFELCQINIDINGYPKNIKELSTKPHYDKHLLYESLDESTDIYKKRTKLFELLGDTVSKNNKKSFKTVIKNLGPTYFDYHGKLMMIEKSFNPSITKIIDCRYNNKGKLIEAEYANIDNDNVTFFNSQKQFMYEYTATHFGSIISDDYAVHIME